MLLGHIEGKITTTHFTFLAKEEPKNFEYIQVYHPVYGFVLCQIHEVTKTTEKTQAYCLVIGYADEKGKVKRPRIPFEPESEVLRAEDDFISTVVSFPTVPQKKPEETEESVQKEQHTPYAVIGHLEGRTIPVALDLNTVLTKHVAVLAKSGAGKSYTVGVLLEEIVERGVPLIIIDPHGEYSSLSQPTTDADEEKMALYGVEPKGYPVVEYADTDLIPRARPLRLPMHLTAQELTHLLPGKLTANQQAILYSALKNIKEITFDSLLCELELEESPAKFNLINTVEYLRGLPIFSAASTPYNELVKSGQATILNLKGINPDVQEIIVYKLCKDLFGLRKQNKVSPFFLVVEEAHNYCPERSFGETKASKILRDIASEGRKFGLGLCVVSQRPARVDKSVLSQCSTQLLLKVTNPNDLKALSNSVEGLTAEAEKEIKNLPIGSALVTGVTDLPLFVTIRPRKSAHGGDAVDVLGSATPLQEEKNVFSEVQSFQDQEVLALVKPTITPKDLEIMSDEPIQEIRNILCPAFQLVCREGEQRYKLLIDRETGAIITDINTYETKKLPSLTTLTPREMSILQALFSQKTLSLLDLSSRIGGAVDIKGELLPLIEQGYITLDEQQGNAAITTQYLFTKLHTVPNFSELVYESLSYHEKGTPVYTIDQIKDLYSTYTHIDDYYECHVLRYDPVLR